MPVAMDHHLVGDILRTKSDCDQQCSFKKRYGDLRLANEA